MIVYPTLVYLAVDFRQRYPLINGQGNFGSIDGFPPAAMRYTEARLANPGQDMLEDLDKNTVPHVPNYDERLEEPTVLPASFPNLICNGCVGIAVTMATSVPPHNLREVVDAMAALIDNPDMELAELMEHIKGPDFPTGGIVNGLRGVLDTYRTGKGHIKIRARAEVEETNGRERIVISEIPFMVAKANLIEKMATLVQEKRIEGISNIQDESDREGLRIVVDIKRDGVGEVVLNQLFKFSPLETTFAANMNVLVNGLPVQLNLKQILQYYLEHRLEVVVKRTLFDLDEAEGREHILEGLKKALDAIDRVVEIIRNSEDPATARGALMAELEITERQARAILTMTLQRLTGLEQRKIEIDYADLIREIARLRKILDSKSERMSIIKSELMETREKYGDERRTDLVLSESEFNIEDLIIEEDMVITISHEGYIKRIPVSAYRSQNRGGRGVAGMATKDEDFVEHLFVASSHSYILFLTDRGHCHWKKVHEIPRGMRQSRGRPVINLVEVLPGHKVSAIVPVNEFREDNFLVQLTQNGLIKKTALSAYSRPRRGGIIAMNILEDDTLIEATTTDGGNDVIVATNLGRTVRFHENAVRPTGRGTQGVRGVSLSAGDRAVGMVVGKGDGSLLTVCEKGYGKRTPIQEYPRKNRGGKGVINIKTTERNGGVVAIKSVNDDCEMMMVTQKGILIRFATSGVSEIGRNTQGVKLIEVGEDDLVMDVALVGQDVEDDESDTTDSETPVSHS
jgi:DNA gyrase subunit A